MDIQWATATGLSAPAVAPRVLTRISGGRVGGGEVVAVESSLPEEVEDVVAVDEVEVDETKPNPQQRKSSTLSWMPTSAKVRSELVLSNSSLPG